ncbi:MAG TPA: thiamine pyrophosphate-dependent enzyme [Thermoanaerobaculaceae bacterium]|nr:thiamine pyrophosphate-dependent enzyme [Thermoanaerobaculaceae bacterium]HRS15109.1 thiamine pyrophosphate-dependent enzyme [Thermoanaerobaculaceae bacterium]
MTRSEAVALVLSRLAPEDLVVAADGAISREAFRAADRPRTFYMLGSMGHVASIALGLALSRPERVVALDGDGNLLMGFGNLAMVGGLRPARFYHLVLDNGSYATTGGQACLSRQVDLSAAAAGCGYAWALRCGPAEAVAPAVGEWLSAPSPALLDLLVEPLDPVPAAPRIPLTPQEMADRFRLAVASRQPAGTSD